MVELKADIQENVRIKKAPVGAFFRTEEKGISFFSPVLFSAPQSFYPL